MRYGLALALALVATAAVGQVRPMPGAGDPRIQTIAFGMDQVYQLQAAPGRVLMVEFDAGERVESVAVGDSAAWQVTPTKRGDRIFVKPVAAGVSTNMAVETTARSYAFQLVPAAGEDAPLTVRFTYPDPAPPAPAGPSHEDGRYRLGGTRAVRPSAISDDGAKTYIAWSPDQALPATFAFDRAGKEMAVAGAMRGPNYVLDGVYDRLLFRLDRQRATARRVPALPRQ